MTACSQVAQPTSAPFTLTPTRPQNTQPTPTLLKLTPTTVTRIETSTPAPAKKVTPCIPCNKTWAYEPVSGGCNKEECLFRTEAESEGDYPVGVATVKGYYTRLEQVGFGDEKKVCDSFVIVGGSQELIRSILALVDASNGVYSKNESNQPVIVLNLNVLDKSETRKVATSTSEGTRRVNRVGSRPKPQGSAFVLYSFRDPESKQPYEVSIQ